MEVKNRLRDIRLTQYKIDNKTEFAELLGINSSSYTKIEGKNNIGSVPHLKDCFMICKKLNKEHIEDIWYME